MPILYNNNPIIIHTHNIRLVRGNPVFRASIVSPRETPTFRASCVSPGVTPTFRALQYRPRKHPLSAHLTQPLCVAAAGFREPPELPACRWETPYTTITVFPAVHVPDTSLYPARAGMPLRLWGLTPTLRTLALAVWDVPEQAHNSYQYRLQIIRTDSSTYDRHLILYDNTSQLVRTVILGIKLYRFPGIPSDEHTTTLSL